MPSSKYYKVEELNPDLLYNIELDPKDMAAGQKAIAALETHATNITNWVGENVKDEDLEPHIEEDDKDDEDEDGELDDTSKVQETVEGKVARHKAKWQAKKAKYQKYAGKGKVEKLERAVDRQKAKLQKAKDNGKPQVYIQYKQAKVDFTKTMIKTAILVNNLKKSGLMN